MIKAFLKLLALYVLTFGFVGLLIQLNANLHDLATNGSFFLRGTVGDFVAAFFVTPAFALLSLIFSLPDMSTFAPGDIELHVMILLFFVFAAFGLLKDRWFILVIAALVPITWVIIDLDLVRYL